MHHGFADTHLRISSIEDMLQADFTSRLAQRDQIKSLAERLERLEKQLAMSGG
jgi:polyhydroxyalkanoate synthesis regulator phasin